MPSSKPHRRLTDIVHNIELVEAALEGRPLGEFLDDLVLQDAILFRLLRISEAAAKLGEQAELLAPEQPWQQIRALGNRLRHEYDTIAIDQVWLICVRDLPPLKTACSRALAAGS